MASNLKVRRKVMRVIIRHKKSYYFAAVLLITVAVVSFWQYSGNMSVKASGVVSIDISGDPVNNSALDTYTTRAVSEKSPNYYEIDYPGSGSKIEIGDVSKADDFKPDLTISTWNKEAEFKLIAPSDIEEVSQLTTSLVNDTVSASNGEWTFEYKPVEPKEGFNEKGGLDMFITAKEKPSTNKLYFTYDSNTVTPYYQGPLTDEYQDGWSEEFQCEITVSETQVSVAKGTEELEASTVLCERPDYVVGSIAFYADGKANHATGGVNYATGKVGHLYAMQCDRQWCQWSIEGNYIVLTIPETAFNGKYPIVISPVGDTFGYTSVGGSSGPGGTDVLFGANFAGAAGTGTSISWYVKYSSYDNGPIVFALYQDSDEVFVKDTDTISTPTPDAWNTANFTGGNPELTAQTYLIVQWGEEWSPAFDTVAGVYRHYRYWSYPGSWPDPGGFTTSGDFKYSCYCTYTSSGTSASISNTPTSYNFGAVNADSTISTGLTYFCVTNNSGDDVNITISGTDIVGGTTWTLSDTATPGSDIIGLKAGLESGDYNIVVKKNTPYNTLKSGLSDNASQSWGLQLLAPTSYTDCIQKAGTITLTATIP
jgi:hypothetical protein